jgi:hypothetical protein
MFIIRKTVQEALRCFILHLYKQSSRCQDVSDTRTKSLLKKVCILLVLLMCAFFSRCLCNTSPQETNACSHFLKRVFHTEWTYIIPTPSVCRKIHIKRASKKSLFLALSPNLWKQSWVKMGGGYSNYAPLQEYSYEMHMLCALRKYVPLQLYLKSLR